MNPMDPETEHHLKILSVCYYVVGGITALVSLFPIIHLVVGIFLLAGGQDKYFGQITQFRDGSTEVAGTETYEFDSDAAVRAVSESGGPDHLTFEMSPDQMALPMMRFMGGMFTVIASIMILCGMSLALCMFLTGRNLARRRKHLFCVVGSGVSCIFMPLGTVLGVFALLVLLKPGIKDAFAS